MTWTAPEAARTDPDLAAGERAALEQWVDFHRATLLAKCAGLTSEQLAERSVPPSSLSLLGLVRHMTFVERWWFRMHVAGEDVPLLYVGETEDADFLFPPGTDAEVALAAYREECDTARAAAAAVDLDTVVDGRGWRRGMRISVRWIYLHMVEEYARHNGHADLLRERIDGATGD